MWLVDFFFPSLGVLLTNLMWLSPLPKLHYSIRYRDLGTLNPVPYALTLSNCMGLVLYGCIKADHFIFWGEVFGMFLAIYYSTSSLLLCTLNVEHEDKYLKNISAILFSTLLIWTCICYCISFIDIENSVTILGLCSCISTIVYYGAPLSSVVTVLKLKNSASIDINLVLMNFVCSSSWSLYAYFSINDTFILIPNILGCCLALTQLMIWVAFHESAKEKELRNDDRVRAIDDSIKAFILGIWQGFPDENIDVILYNKYSLCRL